SPFISKQGNLSTTCGLNEIMNTLPPPLYGCYTSTRRCAGGGPCLWCFAFYRCYICVVFRGSAAEKQRLRPVPLRIVGAVATGAVIESGSNSSGRYAKYADGTMICWTVFNLGTITVAQNDGDVINWAFPAEFISTIGLVVHAQPMGWAANRFIFCATPQAATYAVGGCYASSGSWPLSGSTFAGLYAIGRWKA
ncbi:MAG: hypothetical protein RR340_11300, partial [Cloacibacillus sp.]